MGKSLSSAWLRRLLAAAAALLLAAAPTAAVAAVAATTAATAIPAPLEVVRTSNEAVLAIFRKHPTVDAAVEKELFAVIDAVTDYEALAAAAVDSFCVKLAAAQCATFKQTFTRLLRISSIKKLGRYRADRFEYGGEEVAGAAATVRTVAVFKEERIPLDYRMARREQGWVIVNYVVDEVDTVFNYRKQFTQLLARGTFDQLIARLESKIAALEAEK
jgi:phospholipid transport system substrate-binding protein